MAVATATVLALGAIAASLAGTGVAVAGQIKAGKQAEAAGKATAAAESANAQAAQDAAALEAQQIRRTNRLRLGSQRAAAAKSGVLIEDFEGVIDDSAIQGELEALSAIYSGATQASYYRSRGSIAKLEGKNAKSASRLQAGATLLGGLGSVAGTAANIPTFRNSRT